jgi:hypothetical protein
VQSVLGKAGVEAFAGAEDDWIVGFAISAHGSEHVML